MYHHLSIRREGVIARVVFERPEVRNAFNAAFVAELQAAFEELRSEREVRVVILEGSGAAFSAGGDIKWLRESAELSDAENRAETAKLATLLHTIDTTPKVVIAQVHGPAMGLGTGLVAVSDVAVAADDALFGFPETKIGLTPSVISPFVMAKIGYSHARALFITGERFSAERAKAIGLVHEVVPAAELPQKVAAVVGHIFTGGPLAIGAAKTMLAAIREAPYEQAQQIAADLLAQQRVTDEAQEGLRAFLERRKPSWSAGS